ncbi:hypothetical protein BGZ72_001685, partial [Mortierella alpina]
MLSLKKARQQQQQQQENYTRLYINEHNPEAYTPTAPLGSTHPAVNALHRALSRRFSPERTRIHAGDRFSTTQKRVGQEDRVKQKEESLQRLASAVTELPQQAQRKRRKALVSIRRQLTACRPVRDSDITAIITGLRELGWEVCECPGESDVCAARHLCGPQAVTVSVDSDLFVHSTVGRVLRKVGREGFFLYNIDDVRRALNMSELQFLVLGMVSRSDYAKNVPNMGLKRNSKAIQALQVPKVPDGYLRNVTNLHRLLQEHAVGLCQAQDHAASDAKDRLEALHSVVEEAVHYVNQIQHSLLETEEAPASGDEDTVMEAADEQETSGAEPAVQWKSPTGRINSMVAKLTSLHSLLQNRLDESLVSFDIDGDTSTALLQLALQSKALLVEVTSILNQLLQDYKNAVKGNLDTSASWDIYVNQHEVLKPPTEQESRQDGIEKQYETYLGYLQFVVPLGLDEYPVDNTQTTELSRPFPKKIYAAHVVDLTRGQGGASSSIPPQPPPGPTSSPSPGGSKSKGKQKQTTEEPPKKLSKKQLAAKQAREEKKKEKEAKKLAAKKEKEAKKLEDKKLRDEEKKKEKEAKRKAQPLKRSSKKMKYSKSSKGARSLKLGITSASSASNLPDVAPKPKKVLSTATKTKKALQKAHGVVNLETGSVRGLLAKNVLVAHTSYGQKYHLNGAAKSDIDNIATRIEQVLEQVVDYMNNSRRWIHLTIDLLISKEVKRAAELGEDYDSPVLMALLHQGKCQNIVYSIGTYLRMTGGQLAAEDEEMRAITATEQSQQEDVEMDPAEESEDEPRLEDVEMSVAEVAEAQSPEPEASETESQRQAEDQQDAEAEDPPQGDVEAAAEDQPQQVVEAEAAEPHPVTTVDHKRVAIDAVMDMYRSIRLPEDAAVLPKPPCTVHDVYCTMVNEIAGGIGQFYTRLEFELLLKVNDFLGRQGVEEREEQSEQRDKISLWFRRNLMLPKGEQWKFYPQVSLQEGFVTFSELGLLEVLWAQGGETRQPMTTFFGKRDDMHDLSFHLFVHRTNHARRTMPLHEYIRLKEMQPEELSKGHQLLLAKKFQVATGTIRTNGRVVQALGFNTHRTAKKADSQGASAQTSSKQPSTSGQPSAVQQTAAPKQKSVLDDIPYLDKWLAVATNGQKHFPVRPGNPTGAGGAAVIGIDLGVVVPCAASALYAPSRDQEVVNAIVTQRSMYESSNRFARSLRLSKSKPINSDGLRYGRAALIQEMFEGPAGLPSVSEYESSIPDRQSPEPKDVV